MKKTRPSDKERAHEPMAELDDVIDLVAVLGGIRRQADQFVDQGKLIHIAIQIFFGQLLMRLERHVGVPPEMKTESADSAQDGHDDAHQDPDRDGHVLDVCRRWTIDVAVTKPSGAGERLPGQRTDKSKMTETNNFAFM